MIKNVFKRIIYDPIKTRLIYDFTVAFSAISIIWFLFNLFSIPTIKLLHVLLYPFLYVTLNYIFGIYGRHKTSPALTKSITLFFSAMLTFSIYSLLNLFSLTLIIATLSVITLSILPRLFFNIYNPNNRNKYFKIIIHEKLPILVVGGGGYIGTHVVEKLLKNDYKVKVLDKFIYGDAVLSDLRKNKDLEIIEGDVSDLYKLTLALNNTQAVVHLAGLVGDPACSIDERLTRHINIVTTRMLEESVKAFDIPKFIFASSCSVYGSSEETVNENSDLSPVSLYAQTKIDSENELLHDQYDNLHPVILRFSTVFGHSRRMRFDLVMNLFVAQAYNNGVITVIGSQQWRPFIHVSDVAEAVMKVVKAPLEKVSRQIFNVGDNRLNITIGDLAKLVAKVVKTDKKNDKVKIIIKDDTPDRRNYRVSFNKLKEVLNFRASVSFEDGIREIYNHFKKGTYKKPYNDPGYSNFEMTKQIKKEFYSKDYRKTHFSIISDKLP